MATCRHEFALRLAALVAEESLFYWEAIIEDLQARLGAYRIASTVLHASLIAICLCAAHVRSSRMQAPGLVCSRRWLQAGGLVAQVSASIPTFWRLSWSGGDCSGVAAFAWLTSTGRTSTSLILPVLQSCGASSGRIS